MRSQSSTVVQLERLGAITLPFPPITIEVIPRRSTSAEALHVSWREAALRHHFNNMFLQMTVITSANGSVKLTLPSVKAEALSSHFLPSLRQPKAQLERRVGLYDTADRPGAFRDRPVIRLLNIKSYLIEKRFYHH
jgi:hypothetical protein